MFTYAGRRSLGESTRIVATSLHYSECAQFSSPRRGYVSEAACTDFKRGPSSHSHHLPSSPWVTTWFSIFLLASGETPGMICFACPLMIPHWVSSYNSSICGRDVAPARWEKEHD
ncbi:hypothetical protein L227DRAFT_569807 [Lentinus tigrinus ALCF2SS1-6]|uniref:Uncharacterized protein n=1 Tax=Lentinus tigrinus ALCF2SS1-6 TaxID=1328759 RepID=A0A5C2SPY6_9APHY|nr:hypothetical protein L227DRAFT_569807 [Lentinus tigrinus ALCF2SS1-6]